MSRLERLAHGIASSYISLGANVAYALISIPLALRYLPAEQFGLWTVMTQLIGYLALIDLGMSASVGRLLIDYKDHPQSGEYGSLLKTSLLVSIVQGTILAGGGFLFAPALAHLSQVPADLETAFVILLRWQALIAGIGFPARIFFQVLYAHQRSDLINHIQTAQVLGTLLVLWVAFRAGSGLFSVIWAGFFALCASFIPAWIACLRLHLLPSAAKSWIKWERFREIFCYGGDLFFISVGTQLIVASQTIIVSRNFGLETVAAWVAGTKMFGLLNQVIWRISDLSAPAFSEMLVRGETARLRSRYGDIAIVSTSLAVWAGVSFALCNSLFVMFWTSGKILWPPFNDLLLALWMVAHALVHCHNGFIMLTKQIGNMRWVFLVEGVVFITVASALHGWGGLAAMLGVSIFCSVAFSGMYGLDRVRRFFGLRWSTIVGEWLFPAACVTVGFAPIAVALWFVLHAQPALLRILLFATASLTLGAWILMRFGLPEAMQRELLRRSPRIVAKRLAFVFPLAARI